MKVTLEFNLPEDIDEWNLQKNTAKYYLSIEGIRSMIRDTLKYNENISDETVSYLEEVRNLLPEDE